MSVLATALISYANSVSLLKDGCLTLFHSCPFLLPFSHQPRCYRFLCIIFPSLNFELSFKYDLQNKSRLLIKNKKTETKTASLIANISKMTQVNQLIRLRLETLTWKNRYILKIVHTTMFDITSEFLYYYITTLFTFSTLVYNFLYFFIRISCVSKVKTHFTLVNLFLLCFMYIGF